MNTAAILRALPPLIGRRDVIEEYQDTSHIVKEVIQAHGFFKLDYDRVAKHFDSEGVELYRDLFNFLKKNVHYKIESEKLQSTRSPAALLNIGTGDCKHYASFIAGVLDAKNRAGSNYKWVYRFASYRIFQEKPQHVFVVAWDDGNEYWIDPVLPEFNQRNPAYHYKIDKRPSMLQRIYGIGAAEYPQDYYNPLIRNYLAKIFGANSISWNQHPVRFLVDGEIFLGFPSVPAYQLREQGKPLPRVPQGLTVEFSARISNVPIPADMLRPYISPEGKMYIATPSGSMYDFPGKPGGQTNEILIANNNALLNILIAATGIIQMAYQPYPDAENLQRFYDSMLRLRNMDFMLPREVNTFAGNVWDGMKNAVQAIGQGFVTFIGTPIRQAFLLLVKVNAFNMAKNLSDAIARGSGPDIQKKWENFGGDYGTFLNQINQGKTKNAILGDPGGSIGSVNGIGELTVAAAVAAATPLIALLAAYLKAAGGPEVDKMVDTAIGQFNGLLTAAGYDPISVSEALGGKPVVINDGNGTITIPPNPGADGGGVMEWVKENKEVAAAGAVSVGLVALLASKRRRA